MELRVNGQLNGLASDLPDTVQVLETGLNWLRYQVSDPTVTNPRLLRRMSEMGVEVVTLAPVT
jgi:hypothetical protein